MLAFVMVDSRNGQSQASRSVSGPVFLAVLAVLLAVAVSSLFVPSGVLEGLPDDPASRAAHDLLIGRVMPPCGGLRFGSAFLGEAEPSKTARAGEAPLIDRAESLLVRSREAHPFEPRVIAALGHLEMARRRLERAASLYRRAIDLRSQCSEARLGLGVALALEAEATPDPLRRRGLRLEALAQFTAVRPESERSNDARFDRFVLLGRVGRRDEALAAASAYLAIDPASPWAERVRVLAATLTGDQDRSSSGNR